MRVTECGERVEAICMDVNCSRRRKYSLRTQSKCELQNNEKKNVGLFCSADYFLIFWWRSALSGSHRTHRRVFSWLSPLSGKILVNVCGRNDIVAVTQRTMGRVLRTSWWNVMKLRAIRKWPRENRHRRNRLGLPSICLNSTLVRSHFFGCTITHRHKCV